MVIWCLKWRGFRWWTGEWIDGCDHLMCDIAMADMKAGHRAAAFSLSTGRPSFVQQEVLVTYKVAGSTLIHVIVKEDGALSISGNFDVITIWWSS